MKYTKRIAAFIICLFMIQNMVIIDSKSLECTPETTNSTIIESCVDYFEKKQTESDLWTVSGLDQTETITNILEYVYYYGFDISNEYFDKIIELIFTSDSYSFEKEISSVDTFAKVLLMDDLRDGDNIESFLDSQNPDGGFGLAKNYASDIIDTKLALKALADLGETEAMAKAAMYIASLQNDDGGFSYQKGLASNPELTAEIADIFGDCILKEQLMSYVLSDTLTALNGYLDENMPAIEDLETSDMPAVYQNFHTALYKLKTTGKYNVKPYYDLQAADGGVFDDPMATALFLELIVREQNALVASIDHITVTNDKGYAVAAFDTNENVNIGVVSDYETSKAFLKVSVETPSGNKITLDNDNLVWNTGDSEDGTYKVIAEVVRTSNQETVVSLAQTFRVERRLKIDDLSLSLSQSYSRIGDTDTVSVDATVSLENFSAETDDVAVRWNIVTDNEEVSSGSKEITDTELAEKTIKLCDFTPDTSAKRAYTITAELVYNGLVAVQASTNYFVSDMGVAIVTDVDKELLYETYDEATVSVKLRDERVVDLILTSSSNDESLITQFGDKLESIKESLEHLGYIVNLSSINTSYITSSDTFAWVEYDHPNFNTEKPYTKHIVYEGKDIKMLGYTSAPYKDFLFVPGENELQKVFTFDVQKDKTDWHSMNGGGFLFNTSIEDNKINGYYIILTEKGLKLFRIDNMDLQSFRNTKKQGDLLETFSLDDPKGEHHFIIKVENNFLSLWGSEKLIVDNYTLPLKCGNGYGPITSHKSHGCSQRSYFTFGNITMQTFSVESLSNVLETKNFVSPNSRYVLNLSDKALDNLETEADYAEISQKIMDKNITFIGLGNDTVETQYQNIISRIGDNVTYYDYDNIEMETPDSLEDYIVNREEVKRVKVDDTVIATDLVFKGTLHDGSEYTKTFDKLYAGEDLSFDILTENDDLTADTDAVVLDNVTLTYTDENGVRRVVASDRITLPVLAPASKIRNNVTTDKPQYNEYQDVVISDRIRNTFSTRTANDLTNIVTIFNSDGEAVEEFEILALPEIMVNGYFERKLTWNTADHAEGTYTVRSDVYDGDRLLSSSTADFTIHIVPEIKLEGDLTIAEKTYNISDTITVDMFVENVGRYALENAQKVVKIIDVETETVVYQYDAPLDLDVAQFDTDSITFVPEDDFSQLKGSSYLVTYEAVTEDGEVVPIASDGFDLEGIVRDVTIYFVDNTPQHWVHNSDAVMELVDNTSGHDHYDMVKIDDVTWAAVVPTSAYNITFNRLSPDKTTQWNSWSAGGRDSNDTYFAVIHEHGYWG